MQLVDLGIYFCVFSAAVLVVWHIRSAGNTLWTNVLTVPMLMFVLNYPVRALLIMYADGDVLYDFSRAEIFPALLFSTAFFGLLTWCFRSLTPEPLWKETFAVKNLSRREEMICHLAFAWVCVNYWYAFATGKVYQLWSIEEDFYHSLAENVVSLGDPLKWFVLVLAFLGWRLTRRKRFLLEAVSVMVLIAVHSTLSTAKAPIVALILAYCFLRNAHGRRPNRAILMGTLVCASLFFVYSYLARYYGVVRGEFDLVEHVEGITRALDPVREMDAEAIENVGVVGSIGRFSYLDGLILIIRSERYMDKGRFLFGSVMELVALVPRIFWPDRPLINFNIFMAQEIYGFDSLVEMPVGRAGEAYFALGIMGLFVAPFYAFLFSWMMKYAYRARSAFAVAVYFLLLNYYVWPDSHVLVYLRAILGALVILVGLWSVAAIIPGRGGVGIRPLESTR